MAARLQKSLPEFDRYSPLCSLNLSFCAPAAGEEGIAIELHAMTYNSCYSSADAK